jgi:hypothetical protein
MTAIAQVAQGTADAAMLTTVVGGMKDAAEVIPSLAPAFGKIFSTLAIRTNIIVRTGASVGESVAEGAETAAETAAAVGAVAGTVLAGAGAVTAVAATIFDGIVGGVAYANISQYNTTFNSTVQAATKQITPSDLKSMSSNNLLSYLMLMMGTNGNVAQLQVPPVAPTGEGF